MKTNFSLLFYLKKPKNYVKGAVPVYLRITVDGKPVEMSASRKCEPELWNTKAGHIGYTNENDPRSPLQTVPSELRFEKNKKLLCRWVP